MLSVYFVFKFYVVSYLVLLGLVFFSGDLVHSWVCMLVSSFAVFFCLFFARIFIFLCRAAIIISL